MSTRDELTERIADSMRDVIAGAVLTNERIARGFGINVVDLQTLSVLMRGPEPLTPSQISQRTELPTSTTTHVLDRLEAAGFIRRTPDPTDRRRVVIEPLPEKFVTEGGDPYGEIVADLRRMHEDFSVDELQIVARYLGRLSSVGTPTVD